MHESHSCSRETKRFLARYYWDGAWWGVELHAYDWDDAESRCQALGRLRLDGESIVRIHVPESLGRRLIKWGRRLMGW